VTAGWAATVVGSAVGSSLLTLALAAALIRWRGRRWLERWGDLAGARIAGQLRDILDRAADEGAARIRTELGDELAERADELMPRLREEVHRGFRDALADVLGARALGRAGEELARRGTSVVEAGLGLLLGRDDDSRS
jgi:hypothetical protein